MKIIEYENYQEKKERGHSDFPYITYPCSIPLDFSKVPLHWHDEMELIYIKKGQGIVTVDYFPYHVASGDILIIVPGRLHSIEQEKEFSMEYENIIFEPAFLLPRQADICATNYFQPLFYNQLNIPEYLPTCCRYYTEAARYLDQADFLCQHRPPAYQISVKAQLLQFFYVLFTHLNDSADAASSSQKPAASEPTLCQTAPSRRKQIRSMEKAKLISKHIENHYARQLTIKEMAQVCSLSQSHFMKFFKSVFGMPFIPYLREYRLIMASRLLLTSTSSVLEIAEKTGFENLSYFNRSFKAMYGQTPKEFRNHALHSV